MKAREEALRKAEGDLAAVLLGLRSTNPGEAVLEPLRRAMWACAEAAEDAALERAPVASKGEVAA